MATVHPARPHITPSIPLSLTLSLRSDVARCFQYNGSSSDHQPFKGERPPMQDRVRHKLRGPRGDPVQTRLRLKVQNRLQDWLQKVSRAQISLILLVLLSGSVLRCTTKSVGSVTRRATRRFMTRNVRPPMSSLATM